LTLTLTLFPYTTLFRSFEDTLTQIGLGYPFLFLLAMRPPRWQWIALTVILVGYWLAWALYPAPGPTFNYQAVGVPPTWNHLYSRSEEHTSELQSRENLV